MQRPIRKADAVASAEIVQAAVPKVQRAAGQFQGACHRAAQRVQSRKAVSQEFGFEKLGIKRRIENEKVGPRQTTR